jgi:hypothetical protein
VSAPLPLLVPTPALAFTAIAGTYAPLEDAIRVSIGAVRFPDGAAMTSSDVMAAHALLSRTLTAASTADMWDPELKTWRAAAMVDVMRLKGLPLSPPQTGTAPWEAVLAAAGQADAAGAPLVQMATAGFPQYRVRGLFRARRDGIDAVGLGPQSAPLQFASAIAAARFGAELTPDATGATRVRILLRNAAAQAVGAIELDASGGNTVLNFVNMNTAGSPLASVALLGDGSIRLRPALGRAVIVDGDLEAEHIRYLPIGSSVKQNLV